MKKGKKDSHIKNGWDRINSENGLSTKEKLEKLVLLNIKKSSPVAPKKEAVVFDSDQPFQVITTPYDLDTDYNGVCLADWQQFNAENLSLLFSDPEIGSIDVEKLLYFDTETTGLSGGTGTIPFMLGFGYSDGERFITRIYVLNDLDAEEEMLNDVDRFIEENSFSATVTYNGKAFDFPLMETRYILNRKRFPLMKIPHLDFLFAARTLWKHSYESRKLGYLGDVLLGISREDDIDGSLIPSLYFSYLRSGNFRLIEKVVHHNELDLVGLSALVLKGLTIVCKPEDNDEAGEIFGTGILYERQMNLVVAESCYLRLTGTDTSEAIRAKSLKKLSAMKKKSQLYNEAAIYWKILSEQSDKASLKELSIYYEHREKNYFKALENAEKILELEQTLTDMQRQDLDKRIGRLKKRIAKLEEIE